MSALKRYRKPGGFKHLLALVETSPQAKREQLLKIVGEEDPRWAQELTKRMLTMTRVLSWEVESIEKVLATIPEQTWPKALFHLPPEERAAWFRKLIHFQPASKQKHLQEYFAGLTPSAAEVDAAHILIVKKIRDMQAAGEFRPERWDPMLAVDGLDRLVI